MTAHDAIEVFKQNGWEIFDPGDEELYGDSPSKSKFDDPGDALLYGDSKNSRRPSKFMDYLETLKSDNEEDNKVVESIMTGYNAFMNDTSEFISSLGAEPKRPLPSRLKSIDKRLNDTKREIEDIKTRVNMIKDWEHKYIQAVHEQEVEDKKDWEREYARFAHEQRVAAYNARYPFMLTDNEEEDVKKEPTEMTLLEKLSQRSDAGLLADKFTNFLKTNSLQK